MLVTIGTYRVKHYLLLPFPPVYFVRHENKCFFFGTLQSAFRTLQDVLLTCRVFSSSQKAIKKGS